jgi:hemoglobin-like flavoprotein
MTPSQIAIVRRTWHRARPMSDRVAAVFYERLFELDPSSRVFFSGIDLRQHGRRLTDSLNAVLELLDQPEALLEVVGDVGRRHGSRGVCWRHYGMAADALFTALECCLGSAFTADARAAWSVTYWVTARAMQRAAAQVA